MSYEEALARLGEGQRKLKEAQAEINNTDIDVKSRDGLVTVTTRATGEITRIRVSDRVSADFDLDKLERTILSTIQAAQKAAVQVNEQVIQTAIPDFSFATLRAVSQEPRG